MKQEHSFLKTVCKIAIPVALQSMLQASFSIVDQIMIGQLGSISVAGVGFAGKFSSIYSVIVAAIGRKVHAMSFRYAAETGIVSGSFVYMPIMVCGRQTLTPVNTAASPSANSKFT